MELLDVFPELAIPTTAIGAAAWLFYRLFLRADMRDANVFIELKRQRDEWRARAEDAEESLTECRAELVRLRLRLGDDPQG